MVEDTNKQLDLDSKFIITSNVRNGASDDGGGGCENDSGDRCIAKGASIHPIHVQPATAIKCVTDNESKSSTPDLTPVIPLISMRM